MRFAFLALLLLTPQDDPFRMLADPAKRANDAERKAATESLRKAGPDSAVHLVAARFLSKSDKEWRLAGDPAAAEVNAFLAKHWAAAPSAEDQHRAALTALLIAAEKCAKSEGGSEVLRLFAAAHLSALGDKAAAEAAKLGFVKEGDRWGRREHLPLYAITKGFAKPAYIPLEAENAAKASPHFGPRYVAALLEIQKVLSANAGFEALWKSLPRVGGAGASKPVADHLQCLADGLKAAVSCGQCKAGKVTCERCQGKKRCDVACPVCKGLGWMQKGDRANVLIPCTNCRQATVFRNAACPDCKQQGTLDCVICLGKGWRDNFKGCKDCKACSTCKGKRTTETPCATCGGKGRVPPMVAGIPSILCGDCKGQAMIKGLCKACAESGLDPCATCGGKGNRDGRSPARPKLADIYGTEPCDRCAGKGWPLPNVALPCDRCTGLGIRIKPALDPTRVLD